MKFFTNTIIAIFVLITRVGASYGGCGGVRTSECSCCGRPMPAGTGAAAGTAAGAGAGAGAGAAARDSSDSDGKSKCDSKKGGSSKGGKSSSAKNGVDFQDSMSLLALVSSFIMALQ